MTSYKIKIYRSSYYDLYGMLVVEFERSVRFGLDCEEDSPVLALVAGRDVARQMEGEGKLKSTRTNVSWGQIQKNIKNILLTSSIFTFVWNLIT